ncbi:4'-phosphopantetheinyl transferase superfamily protein [Nonomuraea sp. FMUSA5-5]|uniref:4'-phosphopantetheinyl transferase superfamily protein n=1 Tax=Nonomuraea composti TaxID=2720023 RepID=A0ABX1AQL6_9ACTN|nr:4'-phosphopantetheinyl transferase superfamily protein [Nonomuraea sp. FMUSA5-5]NJP87908.1 4'-phosphopantetheinyl transferase superfamily protein [Nonomuraea sp. FMUSA5-5]
MGGRPDEVRAPDDWLTEVEKERAARFRFDTDRTIFIAAHLLVRLCAAEVLGEDPARLTLLQYCEMHGFGHGRPYFEQYPDLGVSFSHTRGYVCAAAGPGKVGVDAERVRPGPLDTVLADRVLTPRERALVTGNDELIRHWTRKEALIKRGELTLDKVSAGGEDLTGRHLLEWTAGPDIRVAVVTDTPARRAPIPGAPS